MFTYYSRNTQKMNAMDVNGVVTIAVHVGGQGWIRTISHTIISDAL